MTPAIPGASGLPPVHALTLGAVIEANIEAICAPGFARAHCVWHDKAATLARYGIAEDQADDDLVPVYLGGDDASPLNHWTQANGASPGTADMDRLEAWICGRRGRAAALPGCIRAGLDRIAAYRGRAIKRIVTTHYRYKRPSRRKKPTTLVVPEVLIIPGRKRRKASVSEPTDLEAKTKSPSVNDNRKPTIVIASKPGTWRPDVPDMTTEEYRQRGDAVDALFREIKRRVAAESATKKKP